MIVAIECMASESRPAVRPRANHDGQGGCWWLTPRLTALGLYMRRHEAHAESAFVRYEEEPQ